MPASIGVNLRVTGHCSQGGRKYMEDLFSVAYQQTEDERDLEYAFFGIYDGHGGSEAAAFAKEHLMDSIVKQRQFWSDNDEDVLKAIRNGYMLTHLNMWKELEKWPKTVTGLPSTAGTTASVAFIRRGKIYVGHVGDSAIVLGYQKEGSEEWGSKPLTLDHKPESTIEMERIQRCGGKVVSKAGVPRVVWNRPRAGHKGPIKKNTPMDEIPFLAVARSLGDLWSYNTNNDEFIVSPDPDVGVLTIDPTKFRCLIFGTDGLWNMISPEGAVTLVQATERHNEAALVAGAGGQPRDWLNPSKSLVDHALERWSNTRMRADNTSVVTLMLDPPGPPRATVLRARGVVRPPAPPPAPRPHPVGGLTIMTRYEDAERPERPAPLPPVATLDARFSVGPQPDTPADTPPGDITNYGNPAESYFMARLLNRTSIVNTLSDVFDEIVKTDEEPECARAASPAPPLTVVPSEDPAPADKGPAEEPAAPADGDHVDIQINEVSSSSPSEGPRARTRRSRPEPLPARVLRSQDQPPRPATRQTGRRAEPAEPPVAPRPVEAPPAALERVVILSRARAGAGRGAEPPSGRCTRSKDATTTDARPAREVPVSGNSTRGPGAVRRVPAAARARRAPPAPDCSKENCAATRRRRADPAPSPPRTRLRDSRREDDVEVHSTTAEVRPRALRSRNEPAAPPPPGKRPRVDAKGPKAVRAEPPAPKPSRPEPAGAKAGGPRLERRAGLSWTSALSLRNRLRKRLAK